MTRCSGDTSIKRVIVFRRVGNDIHMEEGRDVWWHRELEYVDANCPPVPLDSEHPLYILYTSGSTGKPKGILHTTGGYLVGVYSTVKYIFDIRDEDIFWCTADVGWVTGHSYVVYGPLANGATARHVRRARRIGRNPIDSGKSSKTIASTFCTRLQRRSAHLFAGAING